MSVILQYDVGDAPAHWFSCQITCDNAASVPLTRQGTRLVSMAYIIVYDNSPRNFLALFAIKQYTENSFRINQQPNDSNGKKNSESEDVFWIIWSQRNILTAI